MRSPSAIRLDVININAIVRSAVSSVKTSGVFVTTMPLDAADKRSMWFTPAEFMI